TEEASTFARIVTARKARMRIRSISRFACAIAVAALSEACGGSGSSTSPSQSALPVIFESVTFRYHASAGDTIDTNWQEIYHAWAIGKVGAQVPRKIDYSQTCSRHAI